MRNYLFLLSKEDIFLACEEVLSIVERYNVFIDSYLDENLLIVRCSDELSIGELSNRLAYTHSIYSLITFFSNDGIEYSNSKMISVLREYLLKKNEFESDELEYDSYLKYKFEMIELLSFYSESFSVKIKKISGTFPLSEKEFYFIIKSRLELEKQLKDKFTEKSEDVSIFDNLKNIFIRKKSVKVFNEIIADLKAPKTRFELLVCKNVSYLVKFEFDCKKDYNLRNTQFLPARHPSSMKAKLSRTFVNLTGLLPGETLLDPFSGIGTCLIEAGLMGIKIKGSDIDDEMLLRAKTNLEYFNLKYELKKSDARNVNSKCDAIVCDLPYGKNTKNVKDLDKLSVDFLNNVYSLCNVVVVGLPDFCDYKKIISKTPWKLKIEFNYYIHKSLSKKILKLVK